MPVFESGIPLDANALRRGQTSKVGYVGASASHAEFYLEDDPKNLMSSHMKREIAQGIVVPTYEELKEKYPPKERVKITTPQRGGRKNVVVKNVDDYLRRKYAKAYALWKNGKPQNDEGLALRDWDQVDADFADILRIQQGIYTVEQLAEQPNSVVASIRDGIKLRDKARAEVAQGPSREMLSHVNKINDDLKAQVDAQSKQIEELKALILDSRGQPMNKGKK